MNLNIGFIPYLNMVPFHQKFGPAPLHEAGFDMRFKALSPRALGIEAQAGRIDAGALSLIDSFKLSDRFEPLGTYGVGVKQAAGSVLLFSKVPLSQLAGMCAVTDETSTSVRLLQVLAEKRYGRTQVNYGRVSAGLYDGAGEALLLIGDEALRARKTGLRGLPVVTDLAAEWSDWQRSPFVFARWMVRKELPDLAKILLETYLDNSLKAMSLDMIRMTNRYAEAGLMSAEEFQAYWLGFVYRLTPEHLRSVETFKSFAEAECLTV
jgi:chorismate dehydratase